MFNVKRILVWKLFWNFYGELNLNLKIKKFQSFNLLIH